MLTHSIVASGPWVRRAIFLVPVAAALILCGVIAAGGGLAMPAQAQGGSGAVPNLRLSSASPGELTITWDTPDPAPSDYRLIWAEQSLDFLSYRLPNEANRGNEYPGGDETSITLTGLTKGQIFKVQARARYTSGGDNNGPWSGPWTDTATARVKDDPPAAPTGLTASGVAHDSVTISWAAPSQGTVTSYRVMRGTETGSLSTIEEDTGSIDVEYTDSTVAAATTYYYAVLALSADGDGAQSTTVSATTPAEAQPVPSAPTGLTTSGVAHDSVTISWTTPSQGSVTGYRILRGTDSDSLSAIVQNTDSTATEYTDSTVTAATTYYYAVLALSAEGDGAQSAAVSATTPAAPQQATAPDLRLSSTAAGQLTISWDALNPSPSDYRILWAKQGLDFPSYTAANEANRGNEYSSGDETSITITGLTKGATFKVRARTRYTSGGDNNGAWSGPWTDTVTARVKDDPPTAPTGLTAARVAHDSVILSWTAPSSGSTVTSYRILRGTDANSLSAIADDTGSTGTEYTDSTVAVETTYYYAVLALSQDGDGQQSDTVRATTPAAPSVPSAPTGLVATPSHDRVSLSWDDPQNGSITGYQIWRGADATSLASIRADTGSAATTYVDDTVKAQTAYHYAVSAINSTGTGDQSTTVSTTKATLNRAEVSTDASLKSLSIAGVTLSPTFDTAVTSYTADVGADVASATVSAAASHAGATVVITPAEADANTAGHQASLSAGVNVITITVTAEDGTTVNAYTVSIFRPSNDATLRILYIGAGTLSPAFGADVVEYIVSVDHDITVFTVDGIANHPEARASVVPADADADTGGHQTELSVGDNVITITVTAEDGTTAIAYKVTAVRSPAGGRVAGIRLAALGGDLIIGWDSPTLPGDEAPTDYQVAWAEADGDYGTDDSVNAYPTRTTYTVSGLSAGEYRIKVRARYRSGRFADRPWSGPWTESFAIAVEPTFAEQQEDFAFAELREVTLSYDAGGGHIRINWDVPPNPGYDTYGECIQSILDGFGGQLLVTGPDYGDSHTQDTIETTTVGYDVTRPPGPCGMFQPGHTRFGSPRMYWGHAAALGLTAK